MLYIVRFPFFLRLNHIPFYVIYTITHTQRKMCPILLMHSSINGHLGCFHLLAFVNNAVTNIGVQTFPWDLAFNSVRWIPRIEIARSYGNSVFNILRNLQTRPLSHQAPCLMGSLLFLLLPSQINQSIKLFFKNGQSSWIDISPVKIYKWLISRWKMPTITSH